MTVDEINAFLRRDWRADRCQCLEVSVTHALARLKPTPDDLRPGGYISGPTQFEAADSVFYYLVFGAIGRIEPMALTSELSIRYLRPAVGEWLHARAALDRAGRRIVVATLTVWAGGGPERPSAVAQGTYMLP